MRALAPPLAAFFFLGACERTRTTAEPKAPTAPADFSATWYTGLAEVARYDLEQARYGEIHRGYAILIFVTEDFLADKQVKWESRGSRPEAAVSVLKLNLVKSFVTGLYPYSMMTSVFTPVDARAHPRALKVTTSAQDWCGHTWLQLNRRGAGYRVDLHSYFEDEADASYDLADAVPEDEIWTRIRLSPAALPLGEVRMIPGTMAARLLHRKLAVERARATRTSSGDEARYTVEFPSAGRTLEIRFRSAFPHEILGWEETYRDGFGAKARVLTTRAVRTHVRRLDYWNRHQPADRALRKELGLP